MPPLPQTAGGQSRFPCEPELMIRAVNVVLTATRLDVAVARGRSYTIRRSASRTSSLSVHESSCKAKDDAPAPNDALGPLSLDVTLLAAGAGWSNHTWGVPDAKPSVPPPAVRRRDRGVRPLQRDADAQCACQTPGSACAPFAPLRRSDRFPMPQVRGVALP